MDITIMSREELERNSSFISKPTLIISINNIGQEKPILDMDNTKIIDVLYLYFDDEVEGDKIISDAQALQIRDFIISYIDIYNLDSYGSYLNIIVQCTGGVSRSAAVAAALSKVIKHNDNWVWSNGKFSPNIIVYEKVLKAFDIVIDADEITANWLINTYAWKKLQDLD